MMSDCGRYTVHSRRAHICVLAAEHVLESADFELVLMGRSYELAASIDTASWSSNQVARGFVCHTLLMPMTCLQVMPFHQCLVVFKFGAVVFLETGQSQAGKRETQARMGW